MRGTGLVYLIALGAPLLGLAIAAVLFRASSSEATALAGYGAVVSTAAVFLSLAKELRDESDLSLTVWSDDVFGSGQRVFLRLVNRGRRKVRVEAMGFAPGRFAKAVPYGRWYGAPPGSTMPIELEEVESAARWANVAEIAWFYIHQPSPSWAFVEDSVGKVIRVPLDDQLGQWIKSARANVLAERASVGPGDEADSGTSADGSA